MLGDRRLSLADMEFCTFTELMPNGDRASIAKKRELVACHWDQNEWSVIKGVPVFTTISGGDAGRQRAGGDCDWRASIWVSCKMDAAQRPSSMKELVQVCEDTLRMTLHDQECSRAST
jgi:hypothetical protein